MRRTLLTRIFMIVVLCFTPSVLIASQKSARREKATDWSVSIVESTMKRYPTPKDLGTWSYPKGLYLYGQYLVYKRTHEPRYLQYIKDWIDSHVDANGVVRNSNAQGVTTEVKYDSLDNMMPGNLLLLVYQ